MRRCLLCHRDGPLLCPACRSSIPAPAPASLSGIDEVVALVGYEGSGARLVRRLKFDGCRHLIPILAASLSRCLPALPPATVVTWVPTSNRRRRERGFDQAELLARAVARRTGRPGHRLLVRQPGGGMAQTGRSGMARRVDAPAFVAVRVAPSVVLVDDVCTTGATLAAAAATMRAAGASTVVAAVVARTP